MNSSAIHNSEPSHNPRGLEEISECPTTAVIPKNLNPTLKDCPRPGRPVSIVLRIVLRTATYVKIKEWIRNPMNSNCHNLNPLLANAELRLHE